MQRAGGVFFSAVAAAGVVVVASTLNLPLVASFQLQCSTEVKRRAHSSSLTLLHSVANPPITPKYTEEEKDKRKNINGGGDSSTTNNESNDRRTETKEGGFVPKFLHRKKTRPRHGRDVVQRIETIQDYKSVVVDESERISVVRFYAPWCKTCKAAEAHFYKLAADFVENGVQFVEVPVTKANAYLHEGLGVPSLPWVHIYHPDAGLCEERTMSKKHFDKVRKCLECYVLGCCDMDGEECPF